MESKAQYKMKEPRFLTRPIQYSHPTGVWVDAMLEAQYIALDAVRDMERSSARIELFWTTYNFEFRQHLERGLKEYAQLKT